MQRRTLLKIGGATAVALGVGAGGLALLQPGWRSGRLADGSRDAFAATARAVLDDLLPADPALLESALNQQVRRLELTLAGLPPPLQAEVAELATLLAHAPSRYALTGLGRSWTRASTAELQAMLGGLRHSPLTLRRQVYHALRDLTNAAWFAEPAHWSAIGYPGPPPVPASGVVVGSAGQSPLQRSNRIVAPSRGAVAQSHASVD
jgi:hypothetical protein